MVIVLTTRGSVVTKVGVWMKVGKIVIENRGAELPIGIMGRMIFMFLPTSAKRQRIRKVGGPKIFFSRIANKGEGSNNILK